MLLARRAPSVAIPRMAGATQTGHSIRPGSALLVSA